MPGTSPASRSAGSPSRVTRSQASVSMLLVTLRPSWCRVELRPRRRRSPPGAKTMSDRRADVHMVTGIVTNTGRRAAAATSGRRSGHDRRTSRREVFLRDRARHRALGRAVAFPGSWDSRARTTGRTAASLSRCPHRSIEAACGALGEVGPDAAGCADPSACSPTPARSRSRASANAKDFCSPSVKSHRCARTLTHASLTTLRRRQTYFAVPPRRSGEFAALTRSRVALADGRARRPASPHRRSARAGRWGSPCG